MDKEFKFSTPVLFLVFNRLDTTKMVFEEIKKAKPKQLFIASDGPRENKPGEKKVVEEIREYVLKNINWKCKVQTLFRTKNLGCKYAVSGALDWFFENIEQGIILEDDCLPSPTFFRFCQEMLEKYKDDPKIMHISGTNVERELKIDKSYIFSEITNVWGWASWRRAWKKYDVEMKSWPKFRFKILKTMKDYSLIKKIRALRIYEMMYKKKINTWDYQWDFVCKINKGLSIIPKRNQISNLGLGGGTHTTNYGNEKFLERKELEFPLVYNEEIKANRQYLKNYLKFFSAPILSHIIKRMHA